MAKSKGINKSKVGFSIDIKTYIEFEEYCETNNEYGTITTLDVQADSILYKQDTEYYYYIETFSKDSVNAVSYDGDGDEVGIKAVPYEDLEIYILEEIYEILEIAIEEGLLEE
jgi:hypothetical protein